MVRSISHKQVIQSKPIPRLSESTPQKRSISNLIPSPDVKNRTSTSALPISSGSLLKMEPGSIREPMILESDPNVPSNPYVGSVPRPVLPATSSSSSPSSHESANFLPNPMGAIPLGSSYVSDVPVNPYIKSLHHITVSGPSTHGKSPTKHRKIADSVPQIVTSSQDVQTKQEDDSQIPSPTEAITSSHDCISTPYVSIPPKHHHGNDCIAPTRWKLSIDIECNLIILIVNLEDYWLIYQNQT